MRIGLTLFLNLVFGNPRRDVRGYTTAVLKETLIWKLEGGWMSEIFCQAFTMDSGPQDYSTR